MKSLLQYKKINTIVDGTETLDDIVDKGCWQAQEYFVFTLLCICVEHSVLAPLLCVPLFIIFGLPFAHLQAKI